MEIVKRAEPPTGLRRLMFRLPIHLYRLRLGWLMGGRFMLVNHVGRKSGKPRQIVIEVVGRTEGGGYVAASGFGTKADWYRNVLAHPDVTIQVGAKVIPVTGHPLPEERGADIMAGYAARHPKAAQTVCRLMGLAVDGTEADYRAAGRHIPFLEFTPAQRSR